MNHLSFELTGGSVPGRDHRNINVPRNNQDALAIARVGAASVAVLADGCGSSPHSEVGAKLGARLIAASLAHQSQQGRLDWQQTQCDLLTKIATLAYDMGGNFAQTIEDYFLFTIVGVLLNSREATFFAFGDGVLFINDQLHQLGPFPNNQPPYVAYALDRPSSLNKIQVVDQLPLYRLEHFLIGSDGVTNLMAVARQRLPGLNEPVGPVDQFWSEDRYFDLNRPELLERRLRLISRDWPRKDPEPGLLPDDTTLIVGRRPIRHPEARQWLQST